VTVSFSRTSGRTGAASASNVFARDINLQPRQTTTFSLADLQGDPGIRNSFVVTSDAAPGDLAVSMGSIAINDESEVELLGKDAQQPENMGAHPWSIAEANESTLLLFNHTDQHQRAMVTVFNGQALWQKLIKISPLETVALSMNELIKNQVPDDHGKTLPRDLVEGEISWTMGNSKTLTGRMLVSNRIAGMARNFSCAAYNVLCGAGISPTSAFVGVGDSSTSFWASYGSCIGYNTSSCSGPGGGGVSPDYSWSGGGGVVDISSCGDSGGCTATGRTTGSGQVQVTVYTTSPGYCAFSAYSNVTGFQASITNADIVANQISVTMTPTNLNGTLTLTANGPNISYTLFQGLESGGTITFPFNRNQLPFGAYTYVKATWNVSGSGTTSGTKDVSFDVLGTYRHSQYNSPQEAYCTGTLSPAWVININNCTFTATPNGLESDFMSQMVINGSGISPSYGNLQVTHQCPNYPNGANSNNSFAQVTTINGSCLQPVIAGQTVATFPNPYPGNATWNCTDTMQLVTSSDTNQAQGSVKDYCPVCSGDFRGTSGHIDDYTSAPFCSGHSVGDYGNFLTIRLRAQ
jgi:hypothetical protein